MHANMTLVLFFVVCIFSLDIYGDLYYIMYFSHTTDFSFTANAT